ncbi:MAG: adenylate kinase [Cyanobium sp.]
MKQRLLFLGPPGAGKGTQAQRLAARDQLLHLSTGDLLRAEVQAGTPLGLEAQAVMARGELVSDALVLAIVRGRLEGHQGGWLLDGFPRNLVQAEALDALLAELCQGIERVVLMELDDAVLIQRLLSRGREDDTEAVMARGELVSDALVLAIVRGRLNQHQGGWLLDGFPRNLAQAEALDGLLQELGQPIDLVVLMELDDAVLLQRLLARGRSDDNEAVIRHRLEVYRQQTAPLIAHYRSRGLLQAVEAAGSVDSIAQGIASLLTA